MQTTTSAVRDCCPARCVRCITRLKANPHVRFATRPGAQTTGASVTGTVRDTTGAIVPGAAVQIRNHATGQAWETVTDQRGLFRLQLLPVGDYHLSVQLTGFTTANANLALAVGDQIDVPLVLKPAAVTEAVEVAAAPIVEARRTELASAISRQEVDTLPLNGRNYLALALLAPN